MINIFYFLLFFLSVASLYYFRLAVGVLLTFLVPTAFLINKYRGNPIKSWAIGISSFCAFGFLIYSIGELDFFLSKISEARSEERRVGKECRCKRVQYR